MKNLEMLKNQMVLIHSRTEFYMLFAHGLQSLPPSPKRAERKVRRRPFREAGSGQNNGTR